jgi:hypothetical protein
VLPYYAKSTLIDFGAGKTKVEETKVTLGATPMTELDLVSSLEVNEKFDTFGQTAVNATSFPLHIDTSTGKIKYGVVPSENTVLPEYIKPSGLLFPDGSTFVEGSAKLSDSSGNYFSITTGGVSLKGTTGPGGITTINGEDFEVLRKVATATDGTIVTGDSFLTRSTGGAWKTVLKNTIVPDYIGSSSLDFGSGAIVNQGSVSGWNNTTALFSDFVNTPSGGLRSMYYDPVLAKIRWGAQPVIPDLSNGLTTTGTEGSLIYGGNGITFTKDQASSIDNFAINVASLNALNKLPSRGAKGTFDPTIKYIGEQGGVYFDVPMPSYLRASDILVGTSGLNTTGLSLGANVLNSATLGRLLTLDGQFNAFGNVTPGDRNFTISPQP